MRYEDCLESGQIRRGSIGREDVLNQLKIAEDYIRKAEIILGKETYDISFLTAYISIFHSARALLYKCGYKERSHFCLFEFVKHQFKDNKEMYRLAEIAQNYREIRSAVQYEGSFCSEATAKEAIADAKKFLEIAKKNI